MKALITITLALLLGIIPDPAVISDPADEPIPPPPRPAPIITGTLTPRYPYQTYLPIYNQP